MVQTFLSSSLIIELLLPFILLWAVIFAVLQKTKILGENKGLDLIVAIVISLIAVSFTNPTKLLTGVVPVFAVAAISVLALLIIFAFSSGEKDYKLPDGVKWGVGILFALVLIGALVYSSGAWDYLTKNTAGGKSSLVANVIFIIIIGGVIAAAAATGKGGKK